MRVALDTNALFVTRAGVARYLRGLIQGFREASIAGLDLIEMAWKVENFEYQQPRRALKTIYRQFVWPRTTAPAILRRQQCDLMHGSFPCTLRPVKGLREVITLYDLAFLVHPERFRRWHRWAARQSLHRLSKAGTLLCISRFTADEAMRLLGIPARKLQVVYLGSTLENTPSTPLPAESSLELPPEFFLFVGSLEPGKNLSLLKEAYEISQHSGHSLPPLLVVGARWDGVGTEGPPPHGWQYLGHQPDAVLAMLFRHALALVFPSKYEGFGLPVLEAMSLGCPVICSPVSSLPEVGGNAVHYAKLDRDEYAAAMRRVLRDSGLRSDLAKAGLARSRLFSWKKCAEETHAVYKSVLA